jgi:hypothetical protein
MRYVALRDGVLAGDASFRVTEGVAQLTGAATSPAHRRRGVQTALLSARLADATAAGCDIAVITTQPGSKSQQNAQRQGFDLLCTPAILVKLPNPAERRTAWHRRCPLGGSAYGPLDRLPCTVSGIRMLTLGRRLACHQCESSRSWTGRMVG